MCGPFFAAGSIFGHHVVGGLCITVSRGFGWAGFFYVQTPRDRRGRGAGRHKMSGERRNLLFFQPTPPTRSPPSDVVVVRDGVFFFPCHSIFPLPWLFLGFFTSCLVVWSSRFAHPTPPLRYRRRNLLFSRLPYVCLHFCPLIFSVCPVCSWPDPSFSAFSTTC